METTGNAQTIVRDLFNAYTVSPQEMKTRFSERALASEGNTRARVVADFIAGMTDRYAASEHARLTGQRLLD